MTEKFNIDLSETEKAILCGTLLGDATLQQRGNSFRMKIAHSAAQKAYVFWKHSKLKRLRETTQDPKEVTDSSGHTMFEFYTSSGEYLREIFDLFHRQTAQGKNVKTITQGLIDSLPMNPYLLAVWFMDDGSVRNDCYAGKIATQGFTGEDEQNLLKGYLDKWGIKSNVVKHTESSGQHYLSIPAKSFGTLVSIIKPIVEEIPQMAYKLNESRKPKDQTN